MCGIVGFYWPEFEKGERSVLIEEFAEGLAHRGPDDSGMWLCSDTPLSFGHRRLSIIDLSKEGAQPMVSRNGRFVIVYNGEVYNFQEIKQKLESEGVVFHGNSDTEVILEAMNVWGVEESIGLFNGMFAFALWDRQKRMLTLARDRVGIKPLFYGWSSLGFHFGSELKPFLRFKKMQKHGDPGALALFMRHNYVPDPWSIVKDVFKLLPGTILRLSEEQLRKKPSRFSPFPGEGWLQSYWTLRDVIEERVAQRSSSMRNPIEEKQALLELLRTSVARRMIADVPLGAFLSGGIDSSLVVALMQERASRQIQTFSIGFHEETFNEAQHAKLVAEHLGTEHTELYVSGDDALAVVPKLSAMFDEPFADSSQIPTFLVSRLAREQVTVSLSGDGGDELFGGYSRYESVLLAWKFARSFPKSLRRILSAGIDRIPRNVWKSIFGCAGSLLPAKFQVDRPEDRIYRLADVLCYDEFGELYQSAVSHFPNPASVVSHAEEHPYAFTKEICWPSRLSHAEHMMFIDTITYLPGDILTKVDRASMAVSLEARVPLLDHEIVEFAWSLPESQRLGSEKSKYLLREVLYDYVPPHLIDRPKMGFGIPFGDWLKGDLREWAADLLSYDRLKNSGSLNAAEVDRLWKEHQSGKMGYEYRLWNVLMYESWRDEFEL